MRLPEKGETGWVVWDDEDGQRVVPVIDIGTLENHQGHSKVRKYSPGRDTEWWVDDVMLFVCRDSAAHWLETVRLSDISEGDLLLPMDAIETNPRNKPPDSNELVSNIRAAVTSTAPKAPFHHRRLWPEARKAFLPDGSGIDHLSLMFDGAARGNPGPAGRSSSVCMLPTRVLRED